jgi:hypothetical protein
MNTDKHALLCSEKLINSYFVLFIFECVEEKKFPY